MVESKQKKLRRFGSIVKGGLLSAGVAIAGVAAMLWLGVSGATLSSQSQQALFMCLATLAMLTLFLAGIVWAGSGVPARAILGGVLGGLSATVNAALVLAAFDYAVTGSLKVALAVAPLVTFAAPVGAVAGLAVGFAIAGAAGLIGRLRARRKPASNEGAAADPPRAPSRVRRGLAWSAGAALIALLAVPASREFSRRHAVLALRARGAEVDIVRHGTRGWRAWLREYGMVWDEEVPLYSLEAVQSVSLADGAGDDDLALATRLHEIRSLSLVKTKVTDAGLEHLAQFSSLEQLFLDHTSITDDGLRYVAPLTQLATLYANDTRISDEGLQHLSGLTLLRDLELSGTRIQGSGFKHLAALQRLQGLYLRRTRLSQPGLGELAKLSRLWFLELSEVQFDEVAFQELSNLPSPGFMPLSIHLADTNVRDEWLPHLAGLFNARVNLYLRDTDVTPAAVERLRKSLPSAVIFATRRPSAASRGP